MFAVRGDISIVWCFMNSLPKILYMHRIYMVLAIPTHKQ